MPNKPRPATKEPSPVGRPSKYEPRFCGEIMAFCVDGRGIVEFAAEVGVARSSINKWAEAYPEFSEALNTAKAQIGAWWSVQSRAVGSGGGGNGQAAMVMFALKNHAAEDYQDITKQEHTGKDGAPIEYRVDAPAKETREEWLARQLGTPVGAAVGRDSGDVV